MGAQSTGHLDARIVIRQAMHTHPYTPENVRHVAIHYLMGRGAAGMAGFITVLLLVRFMDVHNYAAYIALSGVAALSGILASLGMERVLSRYVPEGRIYRPVTQLSHFIWVTSAIRLAAALLIVLLLYMLWPAVDRFLAVAEFKVFPVSLACFIVAEALYQHFSAVLQALVMQKVLTRLLVIQWAGRLLLIAIIVSMKSAISWQEALWIFAIPELLGVAGFIFVIRRHLQGLAEPEAADGSWPEYGKVAGVGQHNYGFTLLAAPAQGYFMKVLTAAYLPVEVVAAYGFFISVAEKARQFIPLHFFYGLIEPMMVAGYLKDRDFSALSYRCQLLYKSNLLLMIPAIAWVAVAGDSIVVLMTGGKFAGLSWMLALVMVQLAIGSHVVLLQLILNSLEKSRLLLKASMYALFIMLLVMAVSANTDPVYLLFSPAVFSLVMNFYILGQLARDGHAYKPSRHMLGSILWSGVASAAFATLMVGALPWQPGAFVMAAVSLAVVMIIYGTSLWLMKAISLEEILSVRALVVRK